MNDLLVVLREIRDEMKHLNVQIEKMNDNIEAMAQSLDGVNDNVEGLYTAVENIEQQQGESLSQINTLQGYGANANLTSIMHLLEDIKGNGTFDSISNLNEQLNVLTRYVSNIEIHVTR